MYHLKKLLALCVITMMSLNFSVALAAKPLPPYSLTLSSSVISGLTLDLNGTASANPYVGQLGQHQVQVIWGDGTQSDTSTINFVDPDGEGNGTKTFSGAWSNSHTYASGGSYAVTIKLYHGTPSGTEASEDAIINIPVEIPSPAGLTVINNVVNDNGGTKIDSDFTMSITAVNPSIASFAGSSNGTTISFDAGNYSVTSNSLYGYTTTLSPECTGTLAAGTSQTCTITQDDIAPKLTVTKVVNNTNEGILTVSDFPLFLDGNPISSGAENVLNAGSFTVTETNADGYIGVFSGACDSVGQVTLAVGDVSSCILTNSDTPVPSATVRVVKHVVNDNGGDKAAADFNINVSGTNPSLSSFAGSENGVSVTFTPGDFNITEDNLSGYAQSFSTDCTGTLADGDVKTCTITNDDIAPKLTVTKVVVNDNGGTKVVSDFPLFIDKNTVESGSENVLSAGSFTVSETSDAGYVGTFSGDCDEKGTVTLALGEVKTCTITNDDIKVEVVKPTITVIKHVVNDNGGNKTAADFTINVTATNPSSSTFPGSEDGVVITLDAGTYSVDEALFTGTPAYTKSLSEDCSGAIEAGQNKTCTITNNDVAAGGGGGGGNGGGGESGGGGGSSGGGSGSSGGAGGSAIFGHPASSGSTSSTGEVLGSKQVNESVVENTDIGEVLGEKSCSIYLNSFIHINKDNNVDEVKKLQVFLNEYLKTNLEVSGIYDNASFKAVKQFQELEFGDVLKPWRITKATGYVYLTTRRQINLIKCPSLSIPMPDLKLGLLN